MQVKRWEDKVKGEDNILSNKEIASAYGMVIYGHESWAKEIASEYGLVIYGHKSWAKFKYSDSARSSAKPRCYS